MFNAAFRYIQALGMNIQKYWISYSGFPQAYSETTGTSAFTLKVHMNYINITLFSNIQQIDCHTFYLIKLFKRTFFGSIHANRTIIIIQIKLITITYNNIKQISPSA